MTLYLASDLGLHCLPMSLSDQLSFLAKQNTQDLHIAYVNRPYSYEPRHTKRLFKAYANSTGSDQFSAPDKKGGKRDDLQIIFHITP